MQSTEVKLSDVLKVVVGIVQHPVSKKILICQRSKEQHLAGLWEFPGGKVEAGEALFHALKRELFEEVGISVISAHPAKQITHVYDTKTLCLDFWFVTAFYGDVYSKEGQVFKWVDVDELSRFEFPEANKSIIASITLSPFWMITDDCSISQSDDFIVSTLNAIKKFQLKLLLFRSKELSDLDYYAVYQQLRGECQQLGCEILLNREKINLSEAKNWHLTSTQLHQYKERPANTGWLSCSCHHLDDIKQAEKIEADFILLSTVHKTQSHPEAKPLGWKAFKHLVHQTKLPVYALGGVKREELTLAQYHGAKGIAGISTFKVRSV